MIQDYINYVSLKRKEIGGHAICPYAKSFLKKTEIIESDNLMHAVFECFQNKEHPMLYLIYGDAQKHDEIWLNRFCLNYNQYAKKLDLWLIWDQPKQINKIGDVETNNKKYAIILLQSLSELNKYSDKLKKTNYYKFWDKDYYNQIVGKRN